MPNTLPPTTLAAGKESLMSKCLRGVKGITHKIIPRTNKAAKQPLVMHYERVNIQSEFVKPSVRSRPQIPTDMTDTTSTANPTIAITLTHPSLNRREKVYRVHEGKSAPARSAPKQDNVRFSHPAVDRVRCSTPMSMSQVSEKAPSDGSPPSSEKSSPETSPTSKTNRSIRPTNVWRESDYHQTADGERVSFREFKERFDGHKRSSSGLLRASAIPESLPVPPQRVSDSPPTLQYLSPLGEFSIAGHPVFAEDADFTEPPRVETHRNNALNLLRSNGVLAVVSQADMPGSAVPVLSNQYPAALIPAQFPQALLPGQRPFSFPATNADKAAYQAYTPAIGIAAVIDKARGKMPAHLTISANERTRRVTPNFEAAAPDHREHYKRVESGCFDDLLAAAVLVTPLPPAPTSSGPTASRRKPVQLRDPEAPTVPAKSILQNPVSKPLPPTPSKVPAPERMNSNGFTKFDARAAASYHTKPKYQPRTITEDEEEANRKLKGKKGHKATQPAREPSPPRPLGAGTLEKMALEGLKKRHVEDEEKIKRMENRVAYLEKQKQANARVEGISTFHVR